MKYSPIKTLRVKNFRNIGDVTIDFNESPIVVLTGENEAGKTSIIKAFAVLALHAYARDQKDFIRKGTNGFGIVCELEDGTRITRLKDNATNKYIITKANGEQWDTTKIDAGLPVHVQEIMGLIEEPETKEFLHIRTYEDQLLFVVTPASTNYKVMYNALKVEQLTKAIKKGSTRANQLKGLLDNAEKSVQTLLDELRKIRLYDIEPVINIKKRIKDEEVKLEKIKRAIDLSNRIKEINKELGEISKIEQSGIKEIDLVEVNNLIISYRNIVKLLKLNEELQRYNRVLTLKSVDTALVEKLRYSVEKFVILSGLKIKINLFENLKSANILDISDIHRFIDAISKKVRLTNVDRQIKFIDTYGAEQITQQEVNNIYGMIKILQLRYNLYNLGVQLNNMENEIESISKYIKDCGALVSYCPKCGETIIVDNR